MIPIVSRRGEHFGERKQLANTILRNSLKMHYAARSRIALSIRTMLNLKRYGRRGAWGGRARRVKGGRV